MGSIVERPFTSAKDFLAALRPSNEEWLPKQSWIGTWIFRGQSCSSWDLTPSAWRPDVEEDPIFVWCEAKTSNETVETVFKDNEQLLRDTKDELRDAVRRFAIQRMYEYTLVQGFVDVVDELGLRIPGGFFHDKISYKLGDWDEFFRPLHFAVGLAKHHKLPARVLDWTLNPLVAAFFAAANVDSAQDSRIAVWTLDRRLLPTPWREFRVPRSEIGYLHAQKGLFVYHPSADLDYVFKGKWPRLEDDVGDDVLHKLTLPNSECGELLRLLYAEGISQAHLMPTYDNVTKTFTDIWRQAAEQRFP